MAPLPFDIVGIGENSVDLVYRLPGPPAPDTKIECLGHRLSCGGQVATTLATCAALGRRVAYIGTFGSDQNGLRSRDTLNRRQVDTTFAIERPVPNRHAVILVDDRSGARTIVWYRDPGLALTPADLPRQALVNAKVLHVDDLDIEASIAAAEIASQAGVTVTADIDRVDARTPTLIARTSVPIFSSHVPGALTGESDPERALRKLGAGHRGLMCVTLGEAGAMLLDGARLHHTPAVKVRAVDTTGAGDVFRGAFIHALLRGDAPEDILRFAVAAAAVSCTREGALDGVPTLEEVERLLATKHSKNR